MRLRIESGKEVRTLALEEGGFTVGRGESVDLRIDDASASREHLLIHVREGVRVEDLGSRNGTYLGGERLVGAADWSPGQAIRIGDTSLRYERSEGVRALLPRLSPPLLLLLGGGLLLLALLALLPRGGGGEAPELLRLSLEEAGERILGSDPEADILVRRRLELSWSPKRETEASLIWLHLGAESREGELRLELNGVELASWGADEKPRRSLLLPTRLLRGENVLVFEAPEAEHWAVWELRIDEEPRPRCSRADCLEQASRLILLGREQRERQAIDEGNLHAAWVSFRRARNLLEGLEPKPDLYATAVGLVEETADGLDEVCRDLRFGVVQSLAFGREERARRLAQRMHRTFPEPDHPCHERAADFLRKLEPMGALP